MNRIANESQAGDEKLFAFGHECEHMEISDIEDVRRQKELVVKGEELEKVELEYGIWESIMMNRMALVYVLAAYSCAAVYGYDTIANGATLAMPAFERYFGHYNTTTKTLYLDTIWSSLWSSMSSLGSVLGSAIAGPLSQMIGRRYCGMSFALLTIVGVAVQYTATSKGALLAGKTVNGCAIGGAMSAGSTYASEIAPTRLRGLMLSGLAFMIVSMQLIGIGVVRAFVEDKKPHAFRIVFALQWLVGILPIISFALSPESPSYLLLTNRTSAARKAMMRLYGKDNHIEARLAYLQASIDKESQLKGSASYLDCFKGTDRKRTLTVCLLMLSGGLLGTALLTQNIYFIVLAGLPVTHAFDINIGGFGLALLIMPFTWIFADRVGRRALYLIGILGNIFVLAVVGGLGFASSSNKTAIWAIAILLNLLITWQSFTATLVIWSMSPQLSSYRLRQHTQSISIMMQAVTSWLFAFVTPYMYNVGKGSGNLGAKTALVYAGSSVLLGVMAWFWIPETRGLGMGDLDRLYEGGFSPRKFGEVAVTMRKEAEGEDVGMVDMVSVRDKGLE